MKETIAVACGGGVLHHGDAAPNCGHYFKEAQVHGEIDLSRHIDAVVLCDDDRCYSS